MLYFNIIVIALYGYTLGTFLGYSLKEYKKEEQEHQAFLKWYNNGVRDRRHSGRPK